MENSISSNVGDNNKMKSLNYYWVASLKDGSKIEQFDNNKDDNYKRIQEKTKDLIYFCLYNKLNSNDRFTVNLEKGLVCYNNLFEDWTKEKIVKNNIRLIYFRRWRKYLSSELKLLTGDVHYFLGFQYNDENNKNHQILLQIDNKGNWSLGDN